MKKLLVLILFLANQNLFAHTVNYDHVVLRTWHLKGTHRMIEGSFFMCKDGEVYIETGTNQLVHYPIDQLIAADQDFVYVKQSQIEKTNQVNSNASNISNNTSPIFDSRFLLFIGLIVIIGGIIYWQSRNKAIPFLYPIFFFGIGLILVGFTTRVMKKMSATDPAFVQSAFTPFTKYVHTRYDSNYFYVESIGLVDHPMMTGITSWQQQVPISQCYIGSNAWSIPLNPVNATTPVPVNQNHFLRGAVAIAANGVAIFNPYTNTGVDAYLDGQLDNYGGHCGRADDYHYHIAPLFLDSQTTDVIPIAFALDGYAIYAGLEPDGTTMKTLDANHGHIYNGGQYHYHGTKAAPYMIGNMVGKVTEDSTLQIIPQASAKPIRPSGTPLKGAVITNCIPNGSGNGYNLVYTLAGVTDSVSYSWTQAGQYTFNFYVSGAKTTNNYNGSPICKVPATNTGIAENRNMNDAILIFPNPTNDNLEINFTDASINSQSIKLAIYNLKGDLVYQPRTFENNISLKEFSKGIYLIQIQFDDQVITKKIVKQ